MMHASYATRAMWVCLMVSFASARAAETSEFPTLPDESTLTSTNVAPLEASALILRGDLSFRFHYAEQDQLNGFKFKRQQAGITSMRDTFFLEGEMPVSDVASGRISARLYRESATAEGRAFSEAQIEQAYLDFNTQDRWRLRVGRQLAPLGNSDYFQLLEVVNPRDERIFGLADLRETSLPVFATRISYEFERSGAELIFKHEFRPHRYGKNQSDFDPFIALGGGDQVARRDTPNLWSNPELVLRAYSSKQWGDLHAVIARVYDATPYPISFEKGGFVTAHQLSNVVGAGGSYVQGDWVLKSELSRRSATRQLRADLSSQLVLPTPRISEVRAQTDLMMGARYTGYPGVTIDAEWLIQQTAQHDASLADQKRRQATIVSLEWLILNDRLRLGLLLGQWWGSGKVLRANAVYNLNDSWQIGLGIIKYKGGSSNSPLYPYANNDRVTFFAKYSF